MSALSEAEMVLHVGPVDVESFGTPELAGVVVRRAVGQQDGSVLWNPHAGDFDIGYRSHESAVHWRLEPQSLFDEDWDLLGVPSYLRHELRVPQKLTNFLEQ